VNPAEAGLQLAAGYASIIFISIAADSRPHRLIFDLWNPRRAGETTTLQSGFCFSDLMSDHVIDVRLMEWYIMKGLSGSAFKVQRVQSSRCTVE
jgi:hypothetical protein